MFLQHLKIVAIGHRILKNVEALGRWEKPLPAGKVAQNQPDAAEHLVRSIPSDPKLYLKKKSKLQLQLMVVIAVNLFPQDWLRKVELAIQVPIKILNNK